MRIRITYKKVYYQFSNKSTNLYYKYLEILVDDIKIIEFSVDDKDLDPIFKKRSSRGLWKWLMEYYRYYARIHYNWIRTCIFPNVYNPSIQDWMGLADLISSSYLIDYGAIIENVIWKRELVINREDWSYFCSLIYSQLQQQRVLYYNGLFQYYSPQDLISRELIRKLSNCAGKDFKTYDATF